MKTLGQAVKAIRKSKKMTLSDLADQVEGYDAGNLSRFENNKQDISLDKLNKIAKAMNMRVSEIFMQTENGNTVMQTRATDGYAVPQINIKDFSAYTDNKITAARLDELLHHFVVMTPAHQAHVMNIVRDMYELTTKLNAVTRRRAKPNTLSGAENGPKTKEKTGAAQLQK